MSDLLGLPSAKDELGPVLRDAIRFGESARNAEAVRWLYIQFWLLGFRQLEDLDYAAGQLRYVTHDPSEMVIYEEALGARQQEIGRLMRLDLRPVAGALGIGLDSTRKGAIAHADLTYHDSIMGHDQAKREFLTLLVDYGTVGLAIQENPVPKDAAGRWRIRYDVIPPWQLLSIPGNVPTPGAAWAIVRQRWIPLPVLQDMAKNSDEIIRPKITLPDKDKLNPRNVPYGAPTSFGSITGGAVGSQAVLSMPLSFTRAFGSNENSKKLFSDRMNKAATPHILVNEVYWTQDGIHCDRYTILCEEHVAGDAKYREKGIEVWMPVKLARYAEVGSFYGRGFSGPRTDMNRVTERLLMSLVRNVEDFDAYGKIFAGRQMGIRRDDLVRSREYPEGPAIVTYDPDPLVPNQPPFAIKPETSGNFPGQVLNVITGLENRVMPQDSIFSESAPRRADSQGAIQFIDQAANEPRTAASESIFECWTGIHAAVLDGSRRFYQTKGVLPIITLSTALVGVVYDPTTGGISLDKNAIPRPDEVMQTVQSKSPRNPHVVAQWCQQQLAIGVMNQRQYRLELRKAGLDDMPVSNDAEWNAYQSTTLAIIVLFNDGKIPIKVELPTWGPISVYVDTITEFMADPRFMVASNEVKMAFEDLLNGVKENRGDYPQSMPQPEDAGQLALQQMQGQAPPGGAPPQSPVRPRGGRPQPRMNGAPRGAPVGA